MITYQWQPIQTAPKDEWIMVWDEAEGIPRIVRFQQCCDGFEDEWGHHAGDLTHWLPLPKEPEVFE